MALIVLSDYAAASKKSCCIIGAPEHNFIRISATAELR